MAAREWPGLMTIVKQIALFLIPASMLLGCGQPTREVVVRERVVVERPNPPLPSGSSPLGVGDYTPASWSSTPTTAVASTPRATTSPYYSAQEDAAYFYDDLAPYGHWINVANYGACWQPNDLAPDWRPYTLGYWAFTDDYGWFWMSDEPFGWCCYHYGRWAFVPGYGWCWVPGRVWGAAWVVWRYGGGFVGWAALMPGVEIGLAIEEPPPWCFVFVEERFLAERRLHEHIEPVTRNVTLINITKNITRYEFVNGRPVNRGPDVRAIERTTGRPVPHFKVTEVADPRSMGVRGNQIAVYRPRLPPTRPPAAREQPIVRERPAVREPAPLARQTPSPAREPAAPGIRESPLVRERPTLRDPPIMRTIPGYFEPAPVHAPTLAEIEARRQQLDAYHQALQAEMERRHLLELQRPMAPALREQVLARQVLERQAFEEMRRRQIEAMQYRPMVLHHRGIP